MIILIIISMFFNYSVLISDQREKCLSEKTESSYCKEKDKQFNSSSEYVKKEK